MVLTEKYCILKQKKLNFLLIFCLVGLPESLVNSLVVEVGGSQAHNNTVGILRA